MVLGEESFTILVTFTIVYVLMDKIAFVHGRFHGISKDILPQYFMVKYYSTTTGMKDIVIVHLGHPNDHMGCYLRLVSQLKYSVIRKSWSLQNYVIDYFMSLSFIHIIWRDIFLCLSSLIPFSIAKAFPVSVGF